MALAALSLAGGGAITVGVLAGATTNRLTGLGFSLVCSPVMLLVLGPRDGVRLLNMVSVAVALTNVTTGWRGVRRRDCLLLIAAGVACTPLATVAAHRVDDRALLVGAGLVTVASALLLGSGPAPAVHRHVRRRGCRRGECRHERGGRALGPQRGHVRAERRLDRR